MSDDEKPLAPVIVGGFGLMEKGLAQASFDLDERVRAVIAAQPREQTDAAAQRLVDALEEATEVVLAATRENLEMMADVKVAHEAWEVAVRLLEECRRDKASAEAERDEARALVRACPVTNDRLSFEMWLRGAMAAIERWGSR
jgi:hypothetical protein